MIFPVVALLCGGVNANRSYYGAIGSWIFAVSQRSQGCGYKVELELRTYQPHGNLGLIDTRPSEPGPTLGRRTLRLKPLARGIPRFSSQNRSLHDRF